MAKVAFIGLGVMGFPMAGHLIKAGHEVTVYNRTASKASFSIDIEVRTADGYLVGETTDWALGVEAGQTVTRSINFRVFSTGGKTCAAKVRA